MSTVSTNDYGVKSPVSRPVPGDDYEGLISAKGSKEGITGNGPGAGGHGLRMLLTRGNYGIPSPEQPIKI